jgi:hypothetical protein
MLTRSRGQERRLVCRTEPFAALAVGLALLGLTACGSLVDEDEGRVSETEIPVERRGTIPLLHGFADGKPVEYYRLGQLVPQETVWFPSYDKFPGMPVRELYAWPDATGAPSFDGPQRPIVDSLPRQASASDFFEIVLVRPPAGAAAANDIKSRATLLRSGYPLERTGKVVSCPVVGTDAALGGAPASHFPKLALWYRKKSASCVLLDGGPGTAGLKVFTTPVGSSDRSELRVAATDLYTLRSTAFTAADQVSAIPVPQNDVFRYVPGSSDYSPLAKVWDVTVPSDYLVGQISSYADLFPVPGFTDPRIVARAPETFCNCPIVTVGK